MSKKTKAKKSSAPKPKKKPATPAPAKPSAIQWKNADVTPPKISKLIANPPPDFRIDAVAILSDDLQAELLPDDSRSVATTTASIVVPGELLTGRVLKGWQCTVRGSLIKPKASRATVVVTLGTTTKVQDFAWGKEISLEKSDFNFSFASKEVRVTPASTMLPLALSVLLSVQRQSPGDQITLAVDGFDITADTLG